MSLKFLNLTLTGYLNIQNKNLDNFNLQMKSTHCNRLRISTEYSKKISVRLINSTYTASALHLKSKSFTNAKVVSCSFSAIRSFTPPIVSSVQTVLKPTSLPDADVNGGLHFTASGFGDHVVEVSDCTFRDYRQVNFDAALPCGALTIQAKGKKVSLRLNVRNSHFTDNSRALDLSLLGKGKVPIYFL